MYYNLVQCSTMYHCTGTVYYSTVQYTAGFTTFYHCTGTIYCRLYQLYFPILTPKMLSRFDQIGILIEDAKLTLNIRFSKSLNRTNDIVTKLQSAISSKSYFLI